MTMFRMYTIVAKLCCKWKGFFRESESLFRKQILRLKKWNASYMFTSTIPNRNISGVSSRVCLNLSDCVSFVVEIAM